MLAAQRCPNRGAWIYAIGEIYYTICNKWLIQSIMRLLQRPDTRCPWPGGKCYMHGPYMSWFTLSESSAVGTRFY